MYLHSRCCIANSEDTCSVAHSEAVCARMQNGCGVASIPVKLCIEIPSVVSQDGYRFLMRVSFLFFEHIIEPG